jgi:hypothetical protein
LYKIHNNNPIILHTYLSNLINVIHALYKYLEDTFYG